MPENRALLQRDKIPGRLDGPLARAPMPHLTAWEIL
jgi:hypothetical protein